MIQRLFVDMDGTLAVFNPVTRLETLYEKGYFRNLAPHENVVEAVRLLAKRTDLLEVYILSSHLSDSPYALEEKNAWLDQHLPEIDPAHRIFPPCGVDKKAYVPDGIRDSDTLLDDYTHNLLLWSPPAKGMKLLNGINHTRGTWKGDSITFDVPAEVLADKIMQAIPKLETFYGYCFDAEGRYPPPVTLLGSEAALAYMNLQCGLHHRVIVTDADDCIALEAEGGHLVFSNSFNMADDLER